MNLEGILAEVLEGEHIQFWRGYGDESKILGDFLITNVELEEDGSIRFEGEGRYLRLKPHPDLHFERIVSHPVNADSPDETTPEREDLATLDPTRSVSSIDEIKTREAGGSDE